MPNHRVGDASHQRSPNPTQTPAAYHYQAGFYLLGQADDLLGHGDDSFAGPSKPEVALRHAAPFGLDPLDLIIQPPQDHLPCFLFTAYASRRRLGGRIIAGSPWKSEPIASVINIDPVVSGKHVGIRSSLQEQTRSASARRRSMPDKPTGSIIMNAAVACTTCSSESVLLATSTAVVAASSAS